MSQVYAQIILNDPSGVDYGNFRTPEDLALHIPVSDETGNVRNTYSVQQGSPSWNVLYQLLELKIQNGDASIQKVIPISAIQKLM